METVQLLSPITFSCRVIGWSGQVLFLESVAGAEADFTNWLPPRTFQVTKTKVNLQGKLGASAWNRENLNWEGKHQRSTTYSEINMKQHDKIHKNIKLK